VNLLAKDVSKQSALQLNIKSAVTWSVFFRRSTRARSSLTNDKAVQRLAGVLIESPKSFSLTRWVGQSIVIRSCLSNLEASRRVLAANWHNHTGFDVPNSVFLAVDQAAPASSAAVAAPVLRMLFRMSASLEADASPLSAVVGLLSGFVVALRTAFPELPESTRSYLVDRVHARFASFGDQHVVLAFYLDPLFAPCRHADDGALWGTWTLAGHRDAAIERLAGEDVAFRNAIIGDLGGYITRVDSAAGVDGSPLHDATWWRLNGDSWPTLQVVATRLLSLACSSAGSERSFKTLGVVLSRTRNRTHDARVDRQWSVAFNSRQLNRVNAVAMYQRSRTEKEVVGFVRVAVAAAVADAGAGGAPAGGAPAAEGVDDGDVAPTILKDGGAPRLT